MTFLELTRQLNLPLPMVLSEEDPFIRCVQTEIPGCDAPHTLLLLRGEPSPLVGAFGGIYSTWPVEADCPVVLLPEDIDFDELLKRIETLLEDERTLLETRVELLMAYMEQRDLQTLVEIAHRALGLPITVFDLSTKAVATAGEEQIKRSDFSPGLYVLDKGFAIGCISDYLFNEQTRKLSEAAEPFINTFGGGCQRLSCRLSVQGDFAGHISIMGLGRVFRPLDFAVERLLRDLIEKLWHHDEYHCSEPAEILLRDMYEGLFDDQQSAALAERLRLLQVGQAPVFCVLFLSPPESLPHPPVKSFLKQFVAFGAGEWCQRLKVFVRPEGGYGLVPLSGPDRQKEFHTVVEAYCRRNGCRGGLSGVFSNLADFRSYCHQARQLSEYDLGENAPAVVTFREGYWHLLRHALSQFAPLSTFIERDVLVLADYDRANDSNLVETLCTYLESGCNVSEAAKRLFVHRNTLLRRIERIDSLTEGRYRESQNQSMLLASGRLLHPVSWP